MTTIETPTTAQFQVQTALAGARPVSADRYSRIRHARLVALAGRIAVVWLPVFVILTPHRSVAASTFVVTSLVAAVWLAAMHSAFAAAHHSLGVGVAASIGTVTGMLGISAATVWLPGVGLSAAEVAGMAAGVFAGTAVWEWIVVRTDAGKRRVLLVGEGGGAAVIAEELNQADLGPFVVIGAVDDAIDDGTGAVPILGSLDALVAVIERERPDLVVLTSTPLCSNAIDRLVNAAGAGFRVVDLASFFEHALGRVPVRHLTPAWFMSVVHLRQRAYTRWSKRTFDVVVAGVAVVIAAPLMSLIALIVSRTPGSIIFRQSRLGEGGAHFTVFKFRTMIECAERDGDAVWAADGDARTTGVGRYLRKTHLDELPQLLNVLRGEMSIVGPRPERPEFQTELQEEVPFWNRRLLIKPGLTGWAQIRCGYTADSARAADKLSYDLWYLRHRNVVIDLAVCAKTLPALFNDARAR